MLRSFFLLALSAGLLGGQIVQAQTTTIGTSRDPNNGAQVLIAEHKGFFKEAGLDAEVRYFPSGGDLMSAFVGGSVHFGSSGAIPVLTVRSRPFPLKVIAQMSDISGAQHVIVKPEVNNIKELEGKKIGVMLGTASEAFYRSLVKAYDLNTDKITIINMAPTDMTTAFVRGDVDAIVLWEPAATNARKLGKGKTLISATTDHQNGASQAKRVYGDHAMLFAHEKTVAEQPEVTQKVLQALSKAGDFIRDNRSEAIDIMAKVYSLEPQEVDAILNMNEYSLELSDQLVGDLQALSTFLVDVKRIKQPVDPMQMIDPAPLKKMEAGLVTCSGC